MPARFAALATVRLACDVEPVALPPGEDVGALGRIAAQRAENAPRRGRDVHGSALAAFAEDGAIHGSVGSVGAVAPAEGDELAHPEAARVGEPEKGMIPSSGEGEHAGDVGLFEDAIGEGIAYRGSGACGGRLRP
jgi:hypothetical protein